MDGMDRMDEMDGMDRVAFRQHVAALKAILDAPVGSAGMRAETRSMEA